MFKHAFISMGESKMKSKISSTKNRTKRVQQHLDQVNLYAAGIDIGSREHYVAVPSSLDDDCVKKFSCFTSDLEAMADWLVEIGITTVAMESTGVYWIPAFEILESRGLEVILVNARHVKNVTGRKSDVKDCQWLQQLHTYGLLNAAFRPEDDYVILRTYMRQRETIISHSSSKIQHMQKALRQMNLLLDNVVSHITSQTGMAIIRDILSGIREPKILAENRDRRCKNSAEIIAKSLVGNYRDEHLFALKQSVELYDFYNEKLDECDQVILQHLNTLHKQADAGERPAQKKRKKSSSNSLRFDASINLYELCGVDLTAIDGMEEHGLLKIISETGIDMSKWTTENRFTSWLGLSPNNKISGGKILSSSSIKTKNRAKQAFKMAAFSLSNSGSGLGAFYRRLRGRVGAPKAINATARKLAVIFYKMIKNKTEYRKQSQEEYDEFHKVRVLKQLKRKAKLLGMDLIPNEHLA
jgi:transposase